MVEKANIQLDPKNLYPNPKEEPCILLNHQMNKKC
jgi:hypothetical protein